MSDAVEQLKSQAAQLTDAERSELASFLIGSGNSVGPIDPAWQAEIARRVAAVEAGESIPIAYDEVMAELRRKYP